MCLNSCRPRYHRNRGRIGGEGEGRVAAAVGAVGIEGEFVRVDDESDIGRNHWTRKGRQRKMKDCPF